MPEAELIRSLFPLRKLGISDLMRYIVHTLSVSDFVMVGIATLAVTLIGLLTPKLTNLMFSEVLDSGSVRVLISLAVFMVCVSASSIIAGGIKTLLLARVSTKTDLAVQAASMMRVLSLPADFFKDYSAGELSSRAQHINSLCSMLVSTVLSTGLTSVFSLVYISQIFKYAPMLVVPALTVIAATVICSIVTMFVHMKNSKKRMEFAAKESGLSYSLISGVQKIKLSGSEKRAFAKWAKLYAQEAKLTYNPPLFLKINSALNLAISLAGTIIMYYFAAAGGVSVADYYAFTAAYGMVSGAFMSLASMTMTVAGIRPVLDMAKPVLEAEPEIAEGKRVVERVSGGIELNNVSFRYSDSMPNVIDNLSIKIRPGQKS
jgi:ABC-type bacteriocin/lantibiotic exporter with double-glycine peptidase domain